MSKMFESEELRNAYLNFTDKLDRYEEFNESDFKRFISLIKLALEGFE